MLIVRHAHYAWLLIRRPLVMLLLPPVEFLRHVVANVKPERRTMLCLKKKNAPPSSAAHHSTAIPSTLAAASILCNASPITPAQHWQEWPMLSSTLQALQPLLVSQQYNE